MYAQKNMGYRFFDKDFVLNSPALLEAVKLLGLHEN